MYPHLPQASSRFGIWVGFWRLDSGLLGIVGMKPKPKSWGGVWGFGYIQGYLQSVLRHFAAGSMVLPVYNLHERFENPMR